MELKPYLADRKYLVESALDRLLPAADREPRALTGAMRYSLLIGGKRLRPILTLACCEAVGGALERAMNFACAMECVHTYSLIHDDLPAMDNDDLRRGHPTCHRQYGEATAILAGDALLTHAFELAAKPVTGVLPEARLELIGELAMAAGTYGMVGGQMLDIQGEKRPLELVQLQNIHIHKTGALIRVACLAGARLGGGTPDQVKHLKRYGEALGLAFQITDDILDEVGDTKTLGKATGVDRALDKATYPKLMGLAQAREAAENLMQEATRCLTEFGPQADPLRALAQYVIARTH
ncbi:farnesyl-diphosphate synthase [Magnetococcus marinus MC-1]|uniref:Farnesyl-diphosphate synthase n=1 Tax=Magnetococcus marinus (strain ATCC BAA-1437 / JCM 17883 / MC-1) TaxID=156889 RepID=A0L6H4_MAGMM|nr:farnesyl diphosphate synthase [Magnetococcus marinus]ABK43567.1 farnesyl-diphosphate synthase [Magnetococcus marinus MC-1]